MQKEDNTFRYIRLKVPLLAAPRSKRMEVRSTEEAVAIIRAFLKKEHLPKDREVSGILSLNAGSEAIGISMVGVGTINECFACPRDLFRPALALGGPMLVVWHTHPTGSLVEHAGDLEATKQIVAAGKLLEVNVIDAIVITEDNHHSLLLD